MESLPAAVANKMLACGSMQELGNFSQASSTLAKVAQLSFKTRVRARYPSVGLLFATGGSDAIDWRSVYRRHWTIGNRVMNGQSHEIPQPSRAPTQAFDDYIFVVEAFEGVSTPVPANIEVVDARLGREKAVQGNAMWEFGVSNGRGHTGPAVDWSGNGEGVGRMSTARSLGVARARPVFAENTVKFRAEFEDEVFCTTAVRKTSTHSHSMAHGFVRVLVARASAPDKVALFYENIGYDWDYYEDEYCEDQNLLPGWEAFRADDGDGWWYYHAETGQKTWDKPEREERDETQNGIYWLLFGDKAAFDLKVDDEDDRVKLNRKMGFCCGEPVCGALYYANGVGEYDNNNERHGKHWSEKTTGSSIELSFCDSRAKETSPKAEDRATAIPTAAELLFRLEHFLVFE